MAVVLASVLVAMLAAVTVVLVVAAALQVATAMAAVAAVVLMVVARVAVAVAVAGVILAAAATVMVVVVHEPAGRGGAAGRLRVVAGACDCRRPMARACIICPITRDNRSMMRLVGQHVNHIESKQALLRGLSRRQGSAH